MKNDEFFSKYSKITFLMSLLVVSIHTSTVYFYQLDTQIPINYFTNIILKYISESVAPVAVPCFFILAGALLFRDLQWANMAGKMKKRLLSLGIPYLFWNVMALLFNWILFSMPIFSKYFSLLAKKQGKIVQIASLIVFIGLTLINVFEGVGLNYIPTIHTLYLIALVMSFWIGMDFLRSSKAKWFTNTSYMIYASQVIVASSICKILFLIFPKNWVFALINYFGTILFSALLCAITCFFLNKWIKPLYNVMNGFKKLNN